MVKKYVVSFVAAAAVGIPALSSAAMFENTSSSDVAFSFAQTVLHPSADAPSACDQVNLDDTQKGQLKDAFFDFQKQKNSMGAEVKNAIMDSVKTLASKDSTRDQGAASQATVKEKAGTLADAAGEFSLKVFYDILKPEQREPALRCIAEKHKGKGDKKGPGGPGHGPRP